MRLADKIATMARRGAPLPYDAEVEWIGFTGNQIVYTDVYPTDKSIFESKWSNADGRQYGIYGTAGTIDVRDFTAWTRSSGGLWRFAGAASINELNFIGEHTSVQSKDGVFIDGVKVSSYPNIGEFVSKYKIYIGVTQLLGYRMKGKIFYFKIHDNGVLVLDFIPVRKDGLGYFFDRANQSGGPFGNGLYGNSYGGDAGFASFGPDVVSSRGGGY